MDLPPRAAQLLGGPSLVVLTTLNVDGSPHSTPVWALPDGHDILMSTLADRKKARNLNRDPRASVVILDPDNPVSYFSVNGSVTLLPDEDRQLLHRLSVKYLGEPYPIAEGPDKVRLAIRLTPGHVIAQYKPAT